MVDAGEALLFSSVHKQDECRNEPDVVFASQSGATRNVHFANGITLTSQISQLWLNRLAGATVRGRKVQKNDFIGGGGDDKQNGGECSHEWLPCQRLLKDCQAD